MNFFLNQKLISITEIKKRNLNFHARYSVKERIYEYIILNRIATASLDKNKVWHIRKKLDLEIMKKGAKKLLGTHDFSTFRASNCYSKSPIRTIKKINIKRINKKVVIQFKSRSFLRNQVRSMVGCLKYLGEKKWSLKKFTEVFKSKKKNFMCTTGTFTWIIFRKSYLLTLLFFLRFKPNLLLIRQRLSDLTI